MQQSSQVLDKSVLTSVVALLGTGTFTLRLFKAGPILSRNMLRADFTECDFTGYAPIVGLTFGAQFRDADGVWSVDGADVLFLATGSAIGNNVLGWFITNDPGTDVLLASYFEVPFTIANANDGVPMDVDLKAIFAPVTP